MNLYGIYIKNQAHTRARFTEPLHPFSGNSHVRALVYAGTQNTVGQHENRLDITSRLAGWWICDKNIGGAGWCSERSILRRVGASIRGIIKMNWFGLCRFWASKRTRVNWPSFRWVFVCWHFALSDFLLFDRSTRPSEVIRLRYARGQLR